MSSLDPRIQNTPLGAWLNSTHEKVQEVLNPAKHGDLPRWLESYDRLPDLKPSSCQFNADTVRFGEEGDSSDEQREVLREALMGLHPWRKGPFDFFGVHVETEWRSDLKWDRFDKELDSLQDRLVLDIGCGSGYHLWRMLGAGARFVLGVDPSVLYYLQFQVARKFAPEAPVCMLPLGVDELTPLQKVFDTVFSMGLLYHRKKPQEHLQQVHSLIRDEGQLVLETLVIEGKEGNVLVPEDRYAKMRNVWAIPSCDTTETWLRSAGFKNIRLVDEGPTTESEQRTTEWMTFQSLKDFLDPQDATKTIEGYPAPRRAVFLARK